MPVVRNEVPEGSCSWQPRSATWATCSTRAIEALRAADRLACEDTRRTGRLLQHLGIAAPRLVRMDEHTEADAGRRVARQGCRPGGPDGGRRHRCGDAGPVGSGAVWWSAAVEAGVPLEVVPGPFAGAIAAVLSGLLDGCRPVPFEGFLPRKGRERAARLVEVAAHDRPEVIYESPHRMVATVERSRGRCAARHAGCRSAVNSPSCTRRPGGALSVSRARTWSATRPGGST